MIPYLPRGLSAKISYIQRKAHTISFFLIYLVMKTYLFLHKINKTYKFYKYINYIKTLSKTFSGIKHSMFQN